jgi:uncharacterized repeat protein (TIGR03803 family)
VPSLCLDISNRDEPNLNQMKIKLLRSLTCCLLVLSTTAGLLRADRDADRRNERIPHGHKMYPPVHISERAFDSSSATGNGYTPQQMRHAYGVDQLIAMGATGQGQVIAIVDAYGSPTIQADLNTFCTAFGIPSTAVQVYYPQGQPQPVNLWVTETSLDVEWAHAIAPGATIVLVVAQSANDADLYAAVDYAVSLGATQVSMSWGSSEYSTETSSDFHFNVAGVTFFAASGDFGAYNGANGAVGVSYPACSPYVVGVGGTTLNLDSTGNILSETAWSYDPNTGYGGGGGSSLYETLPSYQASWDTLSGTTRGVPDVAYYANPTPGVPVYQDGGGFEAGWVPVGGTSSGSPQWAALCALANSLRSQSINSSPGILYSLATSDYAGYYHDIISGSNGAYSAGTGYDLVTGLGSPIANQLVPALAGGFSSQVAAPAFSPPAGVYLSGHAQNVAIISATPGASIRYTTDGSTPTETYGTLYSSPVSISAATTLTAIAYETGLTDSPVASSSYTFLPQVTAPTFSPGGNLYLTAQVVTISTATSGASIRYTTDGSTPTETNGTLYTGPVSIGSPTTNLQAIAFKSGSIDSPVTSGLYTVSLVNVLYNFTTANNGGYNPWAGLMQGKDGNFYGTTANGGSGGDGTVFKLTPSGVLTTLVSFTGANGVTPFAGLVQGSDGNFYGMTTYGGSSNLGTVFKMTPAGVLTTLVSFTGANGANPFYETLVQGSDGNFYGTTQVGGGANGGTVFKMTPAGVLTTLVSFSGANGLFPTASLIQGSDGNFYGTTVEGGSTYGSSGAPQGDGTVFKLTPAGVLTTLVSFTGVNGNGLAPWAALVQGSDGNFYGTTEEGGGTVFKLTPTGVLTTLVSFGGANGAFPHAGLVLGHDGNFYGTTYEGGGFSNDGTVFKMTPAGVLSTLVWFAGPNGAQPPAVLMQGSDGNFYGTTPFGGSGGTGDGVIFQLMQAAAPVFSPAAGTYTSAQAVTITSATSGASIIYTTDGTTPAESGGSITNGTLLSSGGSVSIGATTTLQAIAYAAGFIDSGVTSGLYTIGSGSITVSPSNGFDNLPMSSSQSGTFTATFDASASISPINAVIALSKGSQTAYTGLSCIARFNTSGDIDAYNGTTYQAASVIPYAKNTTYHFRMVVNVPANTYSVYVTPPGGSELTVGLNYKFRTAATSLDTWTIDVNATPGGSLTVSNRSVSGSGGTVAAPSFSPGAGTYSTAQTVLINDSTSGASIRYTTDGSTPSETAGTLYTGSISISATTILKAIAYETGMTDSPVTTGTYTITLPPAAPVFSPGAGTYTSAPTVTITSSGATAIYYTTNGSTPTSSSTLYTGPITISTSLTLEAIGTNSSGTSPVTTGNYTINLSQQVAPPVFNPSGGTFSSPQTVTITSTTSGASIRYTTDGSTPSETAGTLYSSPVSISVTATLKAIAYKTGMTDSTITTGNYTIIPPPSAPVFSPGAGTYTSAPTVTITSSGATAIYYTTNGSTPTSSSTLYTGPILVSTSLMLEAIGTNSSGTSPVTTGQYTINPPPQVTPPTFSPVAGTYTSAQTVTITSATSGASIAYTTDGSTPTESGGTVTHGTALANGGAVTISVTTTLKAMAFKSGMTDSTVTTGVYTISSVTRSLTGTSSDGWHALALTAAQTGTFTATFDATPSVSPENAVVGLSKGVATGYTGLSCIARFNTSGDIDAYNGTGYQAASVIPYTKNITYHFRMVVNVPAHTYSVYVTPAGGTELTVGLNYAFRVTQTSLDTWNLDVNATPSGCSLTANNLNP